MIERFLSEHNCAPCSAAGRLSRLAASLVLLCSLVPPALAQDWPSIPENDARFAASPFTLHARGDLGRVGFRPSGALSECASNVAGMNAPRFVGCRESRVFNTSEGTRFLNFEQPFILAAPATDVPSGVDRNQLNGKGYNFQTNAILPSRREELLASDRSGRDLLALGVTATTDGSCRDFSGLINGDVFEGTQLLPHTSCQPTWPRAGNWEGRKRITLEGFVAAQGVVNATGKGDPFAFWRVPDELTTGRPLGDQATFGEFVDYSVDLIARYPTVVPGGGGQEPLLRGWPMGITVQFDAFYFNLPGINNAYFFQYLIINDSEKVWGKPVDYDSLYVGTLRLQGNFGQQQANHIDIPRGGLYVRPCTRRIATAKPSPFTGSLASCQNNDGFIGGAQGWMILKSPIGDLRNKLLSDATSPFFNPTHPEAGDTITFNHSHGCNFIVCTAITMDFSERSAFGLVSSTLDNLLDGRDPAALDEAGYFNSVHPSEVWPTRGDFNKYVPGVHDSKPKWDYNEDGKPDTLYVDTCGSKGCVALWQDTVPGGYINRFGQVAPLFMGPFKLAAGDTTSLIIAFVADRDSASFESTVQNAYNLYMSFFLVPEPAPVPDISTIGIGVTGGQGDSAEVRVHLTDEARNFVDPFLLKLASEISAASPGSDLGKLRSLNPWLVDSLRARARKNVKAIYAFKSCDGAQTFTDDGNCLPDPVPVADQTSKWNGIGWLPFAQLDPETSVFRDQTVISGLSYLYSLVTETVGAKWRLLVDNGPGTVPTDAAGKPICVPSRCRAHEIEFAPSILSPLNKTPDARGVVAVYVPVRRQAGSVAAASRVESALGEALVPVRVSLTLGARDGAYRAIFADTLVVTTTVVTTDKGGGRLDTVSVSASVRTSGASPATFTANRLVTLRGETLVSTETTPDPSDPKRATTRTVHRVVRVTAGAVPLLLVETTAGANRPLLATGVLETNKTTPGAFLERPDFPGFLIDVDAGSGTRFARQYFQRPRGDSLPSNVTAGQAIEWQTAQSRALAGVYGHYLIEWADRPYGPGEEFRVGAALQNQFTTSLNGRAAATTSVTSAEIATKIATALGIRAPTLKAFALPFKVRNLTDNREVQVAVVEHFDKVLLGQGRDTATVTGPDGKWTPGDRIVLVESIGGTATPTWDVILGCTSTVRRVCDATNQSAYAAVVEAGVRHNLVYYRPLSARVEFTVTVTPSGNDPARTTADLANIRVVPNPYVFFSRYERSGAARVIKFAGVPEEGKVRIYTVTGQFVQEITWAAADLNAAGDLEWDLTTRENTEIAFGLYIWVLDSPAGQARGKFVVIR
ncbi:MAG: hypothetical protein HY704_14155 [Gemmatimonadetes bacterium]|nr:hypothetical protein [Gemmatimonadota bacterium]